MRPTAKNLHQFVSSTPKFWLTHFICFRHILPRKGGDFKRNDDVYDEIDKNEVAPSKAMDSEPERVARTPQAMAEEARIYRGVCAPFVAAEFRDS